MFKIVLLLVDSTEASTSAAECAISIAKACNAELTALSVVDTATLRQLLTDKIMVAEEMEEYERELELSGRRQLAFVQELGRKAGIEIKPAHGKGAIHSVVLVHQENTKTDLIVLSAFRPSQVNRDLLAKEKHIILDEATCAVMVVKKC